jgi:hypothetical protein
MQELVLKSKTLQTVSPSLYVTLTDLGKNSVHNGSTAVFAGMAESCVQAMTLTHINVRQLDKEFCCAHVTSSTYTHQHFTAHIDMT